jgi:phage recombination protein Bet
MSAEQFTADERQLIFNLLGVEKNAAPTEFEVDLFVRQCERTKLDPFDRQIYAQFRADRRTNKQRMSVQATIDGFRVVAERSGKYVGQDGPYWCGPDGKWVDVWLSDDAPAAAKIGVWKTGAKAPTYGVATFKEYAQRGKSGSLSGLWGKMPSNQLSKCAEALALRKAFPNELSGIYTTEEMAQADNPVDSEAVDITAQPALPAAPNSKPKPDVVVPAPAVTVGPSRDIAPETPKPPARKSEDSATGDEIDALRELIALTETGDPFLRMQLINFGLDDVGPVDEMLAKLTVGQAVHLMTAINERMAA